MQAKWKRMTTVALTGALVASQALVGSAAGGTITADMSTTTPVMRVVVPTAMAVAVNEFEVGDAGSQITSGEFTMKNVSEIPVSVKVTSTATLGDVTLVSTKKEAQDSTDAEHPAMWLAAAAAVAKNSTSNALEYVGGTAADKTAGALAGTEANVTAFATVTPEGGGTATHTAVQDFYLTAATDPQYKAVTGKDAKKIGAGADYYELTEANNTSDDAAGAAALAAVEDIYVAAQAPADGAGEELTPIAKGTAAADITWTSGQKAYKMAATATDFTSLADTTVYLHIDSATAPTAGGDVAAFRYVGALSSAKSDSWSSTSDLTAVTIAYAINGVSTNAFEKVADDLTYGYMGEDVGPKASGSLSTTNLSVTISGLGEGVTLTKAEVIKTDNSSVSMISGTHYTFANGTFKVVKAALADSSTYASWKLTFSDSSTVTIAIQ